MDEERDRRRYDERFLFLGLLGLVVVFFQQQALKLQAHEYDRRLHDLNNSHARLDQAVADNVSSELFGTFQDTYKTDADRDQGRFVAIERFHNKLLGAVAVAVVVVPMITAIVVYLLTRHAIPSTK